MRWVSRHHSGTHNAIAGSFVALKTCAGDAGTHNAISTGTPDATYEFDASSPFLQLGTNDERAMCVCVVSGHRASLLLALD